MKASIYNKVCEGVKRYLLSCLLCLLPLCLTAQTVDEQNRSILERAEADYQIGRLEQVQQTLKNRLGGFDGSMRQSAFRLLSLCALGQDDEEAAEQYAQQLLNENPYYSPTISDPQRFIEMVERIKSGRAATVTTASSQAESLNEVPVPTTLITAEMIRECGGRNLQEVLAAYVPGMNIIDCDDDINIAMRGVYNNSQEMMLIMLNGHRLNSYCTNIAAPDFSIALEKVRQIEVLRGPASSLYGGVALTAVVNIITWTGAEVDGFKVRAGAGSYGQLRADAMFGKRYFDLDLLLWGSIFRSKGEKRYVPCEETGLGMYDGDAIIGATGDNPSYDAGLQLNYKGVQFFYNTTYSQVKAPLSYSYLYTPYNYDEYKTFNGVGPGFTTIAHHVNMSYEKQWGKLWMKGVVTYDKSDLTHYQIISDQQAAAIMSVLPLPDTVANQLYGRHGIFRYVNGQEHTFGGKALGNWSYIDNGTHKGQLTFGAEFSRFDLDDTRFAYGYDYTEIFPEDYNITLMGIGHESNLNGFVQLKHHWHPFILNAGLRMDYKKRYDNSKTRELSPRLALIFMQPRWNVKFSYSKSFIDAPYLYRKTNEVLYSYIGLTGLPSTLNPETLHSWQLTFNANNWLKGFDFEVNGFLNHAHELVFLLVNQHVNSGEMNNHGVEVTCSYKTNKFSAQVNTTWQHANKNVQFYWDEKKLINTPEIMGNAVLAWKPWKNLKLHSHLQFYGKQQSFHINIVRYGIYLSMQKRFTQLVTNALEDPESVTDEQMMKAADELLESFTNIPMREEYPARLIFNVGANYTIGPIEASVNVHNLFNHKYSQSGMSTGLIPQRGRWLLFDIAYRF